MARLHDCQQCSGLRDVTILSAGTLCKGKTSGLRGSEAHANLPSGLYNSNVCFSPRQQREAATILFVKAKLRKFGLRLDSLARAVADLRRKSLPLAASRGRGGASLLRRLNSKVAGLPALQNSEVVGLEEPAKAARDSDFLRQGFPVMGYGLNW